MEKIQLRKITEAIKNAGLTAKDIVVEDDKKQFVSVRVKDSPLRYTFIVHSAHFDQVTYEFVPYKPNNRTSVVKSSSNKSILIDVAIKEIFIGWLENSVKRYLLNRDMPDPIDEFIKGSTFSFTENIPGDEESNFTDKEREQIHNAVEQLRLSIIENYQLSNEKLEHIERELKYLKEATHRLNKKDWKAVAEGIILNIAVNLTSEGIVAVGTLLLKYEIPELFKGMVVTAAKLLLA